MMSQLALKGRGQWAAVSVAVLGANAPLMLLLSKGHAEPEAVKILFLLYPGQFLWCLLSFPLATFFTLRALQEGRQDEVFRSHERAHGALLRLCAILVAAAVAVGSYFGDSQTLYALSGDDGLKRATTLRDSLATLDLAREIDEDSNRGVVRYIRSVVRTPDGELQPKLPEALAKRSDAERLSSTAWALRGVFRSARESGAMLVAEMIELTIVIFTATRLLFFCGFLAVKYWGSRSRNALIATRRAGLFAYVAILAFFAWIPCRLHSIQLERMLDPSFSSLPAPQIAAFALSLALVLLWSLSSAKRSRLIGSLNLLPAVATGLIGSTDVVIRFSALSGGLGIASILVLWILAVGMTLLTLLVCLSNVEHADAHI